MLTDEEPNFAPDIAHEIAALAEADQGEKFMGIPDSWYEPPHWWCENNHRSRWYLKSEALGYWACPVGSCHKPVFLGPAEIPGREPG